MDFKVGDIVVAKSSSAPANDCAYIAGAAHTVTYLDLINNRIDTRSLLNGTENGWGASMFTKISGPSGLSSLEKIIYNIKD